MGTDDPQAVFVSATPGPYEAKHETCRAEQLVRPTGLIDPPIEVRPSEGQIDDLFHEVQARAARGERSLVTTVTKSWPSELPNTFQNKGCGALAAQRPRYPGTNRNLT